MAARGEEGFALGRGERLGGDEDHLAENTKTGVGAALGDEMAELGLLGGVAVFGPSEESVAHLVGQGDEVEFGGGEGLFGDGTGVVIIIVGLRGSDGDFWALEDEAISGADVLVKFALGKLDGGEEFASVKFAPSGDGETLVAEHAGEASGGGEELGRFGGRSRRFGPSEAAHDSEFGAGVEVGKGLGGGGKLTEAGDGQFDLVLEAKV